MSRHVPRSDGSLLMAAYVALFWLVLALVVLSIPLTLVRMALA